MELREKLYSRNYGADLTVASRTLNGRTWEVEEALLTADGRGVIAEWADASEDSGEAVYYERRAADGRTLAHGWADARSRKIIQTG